MLAVWCGILFKPSDLSPRGTVRQIAARAFAVFLVPSYLSLWAAARWAESGLNGSIRGCGHGNLVDPCQVAAIVLYLLGPLAVLLCGWIFWLCTRQHGLKHLETLALLRFLVGSLSCGLGVGLSFSLCVFLMTNWFLSLR